MSFLLILDGRNSKIFSLQFFWKFFFLKEELKKMEKCEFKRNISGIQREQAKSRSTFSESWVKVSAQRGPRAASQQEGYSSQARVSENGIVIGRPASPGLQTPSRSTPASPG